MYLTVEDDEKSCKQHHCLPNNDTKNTNLINLPSV